MWQILGPLAAIIGLAGLMLLNSLRSRRRAERDVGPRIPEYFMRPRDPGKVLGKRISDEIEQLLKAADPLAGQPSARLSVTAAQLRQRAERRPWWRWRR